MRSLLGASPVRAARRARFVLAGLGAAFLALDVLLVAGVVALPAKASGCGGQASPGRRRPRPRRGSRSGLLMLRVGDGRAHALVTANAARLNHPAVSPDGRQIAFLSHSNGIVAELAVCDLGRHTTRTLSMSVPAGNFPLSWDWNGKTLVFLGGDALGWGADQRPFLVEPSGRRLRPLAGDSPWYYDDAVLSPTARSSRCCSSGRTRTGASRSSSRCSTCARGS